MNGFLSSTHPQKTPNSYSSEVDGIAYRFGSWSDRPHPVLRRRPSVDNISCLNTGATVGTVANSCNIFVNRFHPSTPRQGGQRTAVFCETAINSLQEHVIIAIYRHISVYKACRTVGYPIDTPKPTESAQADSSGNPDVSMQTPKDT